MPKAKLVRSAECAEVLHGTAAVKEGVRRHAAGIGIPHDLPAVVDAIGVTAARSAECAEVLHGAAAVKEGVAGIAAGIGIPHDLPAVVDASRRHCTFRRVCRGRSRCTSPRPRRFRLPTAQATRTTRASTFSSSMPFLSTGMHRFFHASKRRYPESRTNQKSCLHTICRSFVGGLYAPGGALDGFPHAKSIATYYWIKSCNIAPPGRLIFLLLGRPREFVSKRATDWIHR